MKKPTLILLVFMLLTLSTRAQNNDPVVSNSRFEQRTDGSFKVDIFYDVNDSDDDAMTVSILVSDNGGTTWDFEATNFVEGSDIGEGITSGTNKHIVWDFGAEHPETFGDLFMIEISANDNFVPFVCGISKISYGNQIYNTVQIGSQCWFEENLNIGEKLYSNNGDDNQLDNNVIEKFCYNNDEANCNSYGGIYQWNEAMQYVTSEGPQGICPNGWHIPTRNEILVLLVEVGGHEQNNSIFGGANAMKAVGEGTGTNTSGFSLLLGGYRAKYDGKFYSIRTVADFWSSSKSNYGYPYSLSIYDNSDNSALNSLDANSGYSVRCLKD